MKRLGPGGALAATIAVVLIVLGLGWVAFVSPQRSKASELDGQIATQQAQLAAEQHVLSTSSTKGSLAALRAAKRALPDDPQMSQVLRQLSTLVTQVSAELDSVSPSAPIAAVTGGEVVPLTVTVKGKYFALQRLMQLLRKSADAKNGKITGGGRLFSVDSIAFAAAAPSTTPGAASGPAGVTATISMNAYVYASAAATTASTAATTTTDSSSTSSDTSAAGATP
jgi:HPt (histidine-containing phosphotransfer) domain-containing protein